MNMLLSIDWGSFPDWVQAIAAVFAAVGLIVTLKLQREALVEQQKITKLELEAFINGYTPVFELSNIMYGRVGREASVTFDLIITKNALSELSIAHNFPDNMEYVEPYYVKDVILPDGYTLNNTIKFTLEPVIVEMTEYSGNTITFTFNDTLGNKYEQHLVYKGSTLLFLYPPFRNRGTVTH